ncbi:fibronectin-binding protein A N-terminus-domain-containing protein [Dunaliella salina]|uniref:Fibronectin-binding protein A N-terminus-domain-containing protein n=1 Tax=Dunaliella salina TaxID=3046 RepID=A0ABQ7H4T3_DUNSA|nr:fibronectin-binding protein A N-terminus-domain-containing protein [Dunaliella salina]|eukprot:KAF5841833.1 fibronectin-binding protein A N-terminus-domain-containing protein [Dunaliella salina]
MLLVFVQSEDRHARLHQQLLSAVQGLHKKVCAKIRTFEAQLLDVSEVEAVQKTADMITANIYRIPPGAKEVECEDWDTGEVVKLPLDPTKSAVEISRDIYKRARKLRRASDAVSPLLEAAFEELEYIEQVLDSLQQLKSRTGPEDEKALMEVQEELVSGGYMKPPPDAALAAKAASKARKANARASKRGDKTNASGDGSSRLRSFVSPGGYQVLVGRNNKQNDVLSHTVAQPEDLWFHIRGRPGSHVALRVGSKAGSPNTRPEIGDEDVQCAADLAAYFSKGRQDLKCDVIVAKAGGLKKPKGAKPGQVLVTKELGNVVARPENVVSLVGKASQDES